MEEVQTQIDELRRKIEYHSNRYYNMDDPEITDYEYDMLMQELKKLEAELEDLKVNQRREIAQKIKEAGVASVELNTRGVCHVEMGMVTMAFEAFDGDRFDYLFLENIGNLVCPADFDTGAHTRVMLLSVPEGWDKVMKYPPMFAAVDALIVTKCDYLPLNEDFDMDRLKEQARLLNPALDIFVTSARTGEGMAELADWMQAQRAEKVQG